MLLLHVGMFLGILPCMFSPGLVLPDTLEDSPTYVCSTTMFCTTNPVVSALLWSRLVLSGLVWSCLVCLCVCLSVRVSPSVGLGGYTRRQRSTCLLLRVREHPLLLCALLYDYLLTSPLISSPLLSPSQQHA